MVFHISGKPMYALQPTLKSFANVAFDVWWSAGHLNICFCRVFGLFLPFSHPFFFLQICSVGFLFQVDVTFIWKEAATRASPKQLKKTHLGLT